jgi:ribosomal protein S18 acetylase RimI-like enzyme
MRLDVFERDAFRCQYCSVVFDKLQLTIDHLVPLALGGVDEVTNYVTACRPCNERKAAQPLSVFAASLNISIGDLPVHGDPVIDNERLPIEIRLVRKRIFDSVRSGELAAAGRTFQKRMEKEYRRAFWQTAAGQKLEAAFPLLPGHVRIMIPEIQSIADNERDYLLLVELAKSANTRNLIGSVLNKEVPIEIVVRKLARSSPDDSLRKRLNQAMERFEAQMSGRAPRPADQITPMPLRAYHPADRAACLALFDSNIPDYFLASERPAFAAFLEQPAGSFYVVESEPNGIVACGGWYVDGKIAGLVWGIVHRAHQRAGLGKMLLEERLRLIRADRRATQARVRTTAAVQGFFERAGFKVARPHLPGVVAEVPLVELVLEL